MDITNTIPCQMRLRAGLDGLTVFLGVTKGTIERNVLEPMRAIFGDKLVGYIGSDNIAEVFGEKVYCLGAEKANQIKKLRGASFKYVYGDEVAEWSEEVWSLLPSRLDKDYSRFDGALNPEGLNHWLKRWIDDMKKKGASIYVQEYQIYDNPFLSKSFIHELELAYQGTVFFDRYILGKWVNAEGLIYRNFADNPDNFYVTKEEAKEMGIKYINIGHDFGGNLSNHAFVCTGITNDWKLIVLETKTLPATGVTFDQLFSAFCSFVERCEREWGYVEDIYCDSAEQTMINTYINNTDYSIRDAIKGQIIDRIQATNVLMNTNKFFIVKGHDGDFKDGDKDCLKLALESACWDNDKDKVRVDNGSYNNDILDALEYSFEYFINYLTEFVDKEQFVA